MLDRSIRSTKLGRLYPGTRYLVCVLALGNWATRRFRPESKFGRLDPNMSDNWESFTDAMLPLLVDTPTSRCNEVLVSV